VASGLVLLLTSIGMNAIGAWSPSTLAWNFSGPPSIMLDWSRPQFLAPFGCAGASRSP
jgi:hypothetical protein